MFRNVWFPGKFVPAIPGNRISQQFFCLNSWVITLCVAEFNLFWMNLIFLSSFRPIFFMFHFFFCSQNLQLFVVQFWAHFVHIKHWHPFISPNGSTHFKAHVQKGERSSALRISRFMRANATDDDEMQFESCFIFFAAEFCPTNRVKIVTKIDNYTNYTNQWCQFLRAVLCFTFSKL